MAIWENLTAHRYMEERAVAIGTEKCIIFENLKAHSAGVIDVNLSFGAGPFPIDTFHAWAVHAYMFPMSLENNILTPITTRTQAKKLYDQRVPKVTPTTLASQEAPLRTDTSNLDDLLKMGDEDTNLVWQPGRFNLKGFFNPIDAFEVEMTKFRAGYMLDNAYRVNAASARSRQKHEFQVSFGPLGTHHVFILMMTNPAQIDDDDWDNLDQYLVPRENKWENLSWTTPTRGRVEGVESIHPSTVDDFFRTAEIWYTDGDRQWEQQTIDYFGDLSVHYDRNIVDSNFEIAPAKPAEDG